MNRTSLDHDPRPIRLSGLVERHEAIAMFGATYLHGGMPREPIVEVLGRHPRDPDPGLGRKCFASREAAVAHVRGLAKDDARTEIERMDSASAPLGDRVGLWMARNWPSSRGRQIAVLATEAIRDKQRRDYRSILRDGFDPKVLHLPDGLRFPRMVEVGEQVWVLDLARFPMEPVALKPDTVVARTVVNLVDHPWFDALLRYELAATPGRFALDSPDPATNQLTGSDEAVRVFLAEADGRREIVRLADALSAAFVGHEAIGAVPVPASLYLPAPASLATSTTVALAPHSGAVEVQDEIGEDGSPEGVEVVHGPPSPVNQAAVIAVNFDGEVPAFVGEQSAASDCDPADHGPSDVIPDLDAEPLGPDEGPTSLGTSGDGGDAGDGSHPGMNDLAIPLAEVSVQSSVTSAQCYAYLDPWSARDRGFPCDPPTNDEAVLVPGREDEGNPAEHEPMLVESRSVASEPPVATERAAPAVHALASFRDAGVGVESMVPVVTVPLVRLMGPEVAGPAPIVTIADPPPHRPTAALDVLGSITADDGQTSTVDKRGDAGDGLSHPGSIDTVQGAVDLIEVTDAEDTLATFVADRVLPAAVDPEVAGENPRPVTDATMTDAKDNVIAGIPTVVRGHPESGDDRAGSEAVPGDQAKSDDASDPTDLERLRDGAPELAEILFTGAVASSVPQGWLDAIVADMDAPPVARGGADGIKVGPVVATDLVVAAASSGPALRLPWDSEQGAAIPAGRDVAPDLPTSVEGPSDWSVHGPRSMEVVAPTTAFARSSSVSVEADRFDLPYEVAGGRDPGVIEGEAGEGDGMEGNAMASSALVTVDPRSSLDAFERDVASLAAASVGHPHRLEAAREGTAPFHGASVIVVEEGPLDDDDRPPLIHVPAYFERPVRLYRPSHVTPTGSLAVRLDAWLRDSRGT